MKSSNTYLKGKSIFIVSLFVIGITMITVYWSGINYNRSVSFNLYLSLGIIGTFLFLFMTYGLYQGVGLVDNFPKYKDFKSGDMIPNAGEFPDLPDLDAGDGIAGIIMSLIFWILMSIVVFALLIFLEAFFWFSVFVILTMLYWVFFRALRLVFNKSNTTKGKFGLSIINAFAYTLLYTGWIFGIVYLSVILS